MGEARIREVRTRADRRAYFALIRAPYVGNPYWVPPDLRILRSLLRRRGLLAARSRWRALLAEEEGKPVACLTAFLHESFEEKFGKKIGTIGFLEALPDHPLAVDALFHAAERWLRSLGAARVWGPINGHRLYGFGCLENRHSERPLVGTAYNPPEYPGHWWRRGFQLAPRFYSYRIDLASVQTRDAIARAAANPLLLNGPPVTLRAADPGAWRREVEILADLHNAAFAHHWGDTPLSPAEAWELMAPARRAVDPRLFHVAESAGRAVGLALGVPDLNEALGRARAEPASLRGALALRRFGRRIRRGGLLMLAVLEAFRGRGLAQTLAARVMAGMTARGMTEMEYCLVPENAVAAQRIARRFGGEQTKTYLTFEKILG
ncbi:MAG: GNAT family N-acetyltransferase [Deltaproteobacteria bacterium]|nr:GNAT family N-acetyltransferase [Deltaproteobacteria bacterium]